MTDEKKNELDRLLKIASPETKDAILVFLRALLKEAKPSDRKPPVVEVTVCLHNEEDANEAADVLFNWGEPEKIDCGLSMVITLNECETPAGFRKIVESEFDCMGIQCEVLVVEVG